MKNEMTIDERKCISAIPGNKTCVDCGQSNPEWACVSFGTVFCLDCSGKHRGLGTHISFVRSITMDGWSKDQLDLMKVGGNRQFLTYISKKGIDPNASIRERYDNPFAEEYKHRLKEKSIGNSNEISFQDKDDSLKKRKHKRRSVSATMKTETAAKEAHSITASLLRTKNLLHQNLERTNEASHVLSYDGKALELAKNDQEKLGSAVKLAKDALHALQKQDNQEKVVLMCAISFYIIVTIYVLWTRIKLPMLFT